MTDPKKKRIEEELANLESIIQTAFTPKVVWTIHNNPDLTSEEIWAINGYQDFLEKTYPDRDPHEIAVQIRSELINVEAIAFTEVLDWPGVYDYQMAVDAASLYVDASHPQHSMLIDRLEEFAIERGYVNLEQQS